MSVHDALATVRTGLGIRPTDSSSRGRREKKEQHEALDRVEAEIARLTDALHDAAIKDRAMTDYFADASRRAAEAAAEVARLRDGLREIVKLADGHPAKLATVHGWKDIVRALLAEDGAAG